MISKAFIKQLQAADASGEKPRLVFARKPWNAELSREILATPDDTLFDYPVNSSPRGASYAEIISVGRGCIAAQ